MMSHSSGDVPSSALTSRIPLSTGVALVMANMVGTGIFTSLGFQVIDLQGGFVILMLWLVGGLLSLCGGLCYIELALMFPRAGGEYHFLRNLYGPAAGFVAGVASVLVGFTAPVAAGAIVIGKYSEVLWPGGPKSLIACFAILVITLMHLWNLKTGSRFQLGITLLKFALVLAFIVAGFFQVQVQDISFFPQDKDVGQVLSASFALSLMFVLFSYSGWNAVVYVQRELSEPEKNLPKAILGGTLLVMTLYLVLNVVFLRSAPVEAYVGKEEAAQIAASYLFGEKGGVWMGNLIGLGLLATLSAMIFAGPRVLQVMAEDHHWMRGLAKTNANGVPVRAILFQSILAMGLACWGNFSDLILGVGVVLSLCAALCVFGVIWWRIQHPEWERPFKTWAYPLPPILFLAITIFTIVRLCLWEVTQQVAIGSLLAYMILWGVGAWVSSRSSQKETSSHTL